MNFGICLITAAPLRRDPSHRSEMVNQVLFGECVQIIDKKDDWILTETLDDQYPGWFHRTQLTTLTAEGFEQIVKSKRLISKTCLTFVTEEKTDLKAGHMPGQPLMISGGSSVYLQEDRRMSVAGRHFLFSDELIDTDLMNKGGIPDFARSFLSVPYMWGGRSALGFDCSGFVQLVFKMAGIQIKRDAAMQANEGEQVHLLQETFPGDLVFFDDDEDRITHVGILLNESQVIHAYGKVRIDPIDQQGIFNPELKRYSHRLRLIKRVGSWELGAGS